MKKILIVFNPTAGRKYKKNYKEYFLKNLKKFLPEVSYDWLETTSDFKNQLAQYNFNQYYRIMAIGGDGTVKNIADYLLANNLNIPLAIIPQGSANVLASSLNIPLLPVKAIKTACLGREKKMDVCLLNKREYFLIALAIGYWSKIIYDTGRDLKIQLGFFAYLLTFLKQWKIYNALFNFQLNGRAEQIRGNTMVVANALSLFKLRPRTPIDLFDGQLEVLIFKNKTFPGFLGLVFSFIFGKRRFPFLYKAKGKKITINYQSVKEKMINIDGETIADIDKIEIELIPNKLTVITNDKTH